METKIEILIFRLQESLLSCRWNNAVTIAGVEWS